MPSTLWLTCFLFNFLPTPGESRRGGHYSSRWARPFIIEPNPYLPPLHFSPLPHTTVLLNLSASTTNTESWPQNERTNTVATTIYRLEIFREKIKKKKYFFCRLQIYFPCTLAKSYNGDEKSPLIKREKEMVRNMKKTQAKR